MKIAQLVVSIGLLCASSAHAAVADLVVFSYNRPIQLFAFLESAQNRLEGVGEMHVIYRSDTPTFARAYTEVASEFPMVRFHKQGEDPRGDFKPLTLQATFATPNEYVIFGVDDDIVTDFVDLSQSIEMLEKENAYAFALRMGRNLSYCYSLNEKQELPPMRQVSEDIFSWTHAEGAQDWNYPHSVDMTLFRKADIKADFEDMHYSHPNSLEGEWAKRAKRIMNRESLCYSTTKVINLPLNRVQATHENRNMNLMTPEELGSLFDDGFKIDTEVLFQMRNPSVHTEYQPVFIQREQRTKRGIQDEL